MSEQAMQLLHGDCREVMRSLPEKSVQVCVTSPPYFGLRSYEGVEPSVWGGKEDYCKSHDKFDPYHEWGDRIIAAANDSNRGSMEWTTGGDPGAKVKGTRPSQGQFCRRCPAWRGHLGLEPTPELFVQHIVEVFREVWRVLRDDGTLWCNLGDSYSTGASGMKSDALHDHGGSVRGLLKVPPTPGYNPKNLLGIPWRVAFALQADGWYLRSDIIWSKPNPMPESVTDRPTKSHEYIFLMTKKPRYYYDAEAVREKAEYGYREHTGEMRSVAQDGRRHTTGTTKGGDPSAGRNLRSVWTIPTQAFHAAHFATFPEKLVATCLKAGTSSKGCCPECGAPWRRVVEKPKPPEDVFTATSKPNDGYIKPAADGMGMGQKLQNWLDANPSRTVGWEPGCECLDGIDTSLADRSPVPCTVLDCFIGSGTTLVVAKQLGLHGIGIDASEPYLEMARHRIKNPRPEPVVPDAEGQGVMFQ